MTTIAVDRKLGCMAADTRVSTGGAHYHANKIFRIGTSLFGTAGDGDMGLVMVDWLKTARNRNVLYKQLADYERSEVWLIELNPGGICLWTGWGVQERINDERYAIGSGQLAALAALDSGKDPESAVMGATHYDQYSGAPIQVEWLLPPELKTRKRKRA
jgi:ATP-dependent protease HslVU (ClpYQ) peptidase subunit